MYSEMAERHAKGISFPKEGRCGESCGVGPSAAFWGCPFASNSKWLQDPWMKVTAEGQSVISTSQLMLHCKNQKAVIKKNQNPALWSFVPFKAFQQAQGVWAGAGQGALPAGTMPPGSPLSPHMHISLSQGPRSPWMNKTMASPECQVGLAMN